MLDFLTSQYVLLIGTVWILHLISLISPGPDFFIMLRNTLKRGRKSGIYTAFGITLGNTIHIIFSLTGLAIIISKSVVIFSVIKILGGVYLLFLGTKLWQSKNEKISFKHKKTQKNISLYEGVRMGFLSAILNPKVTLFYLSLFSLVIPPETSFQFQAGIAILLILDVLVWMIGIAFIFSRKTVQNIFNKSQNIFNKSIGGILTFLGGKICLSSLRKISSHLFLLPLLFMRKG